jgi:serine/threonine protein kinase
MVDAAPDVATVLARMKRVRELDRALPTEPKPASAAETFSRREVSTESIFRGPEESRGPAEVTSAQSPNTPTVKVPANHIIGPYHLQSIIGRGGMGIVFKADDTRLHRSVALKMLFGGNATDVRMALRFATEAQTLAKLDHPNVIPVYDVSEWEGHPFFVMKFVTGGTLADAAPRLRKNPRSLVELLAKVCRAVGYLHDKHVIHRDLKPLNILLGPGDVPQVADFGLAKLHDSDSNLTDTNSLLGTRYYMSPEKTAGTQASNAPPELLKASDIWSLGVIIYEMISGQLPFHSDNQVELFRKICEQEPAGLAWQEAGPDAALNAVVRRALMKDPAERYASAHDLADDLERWLNGEAVLAPPPPRKVPWKWIGLAAVAVLGLATTLMLIPRRAPDPVTLVGATGENVSFTAVTGCQPITGLDPTTRRFSLKADGNFGIAMISLGDVPFEGGYQVDAKMQQMELASPTLDAALAGVYVQGTTIADHGSRLYAVAVAIDALVGPQANPLFVNATIPAAKLDAFRWNATLKDYARLQFLSHGPLVPCQKTTSPTPGVLMPVRFQVDRNGNVKAFTNVVNPMTPLAPAETALLWKSIDNDGVVPKAAGRGIGLYVENCRATFSDVIVTPWDQP